MNLLCKFHSCQLHFQSFLCYEENSLSQETNSFSSLKSWMIDLWTASYHHPFEYQALSQLIRHHLHSIVSSSDYLYMVCLYPLQLTDRKHGSFPMCLESSLASAPLCFHYSYWKDLTLWGSLETQVRFTLAKPADFELSLLLLRKSLHDVRFELGSLWC